MSSFRLTKWYLDVLESSGRGMIAYQADLSWGKVSLHYDGIVPIGNAGFRSTGSFSSQGVVNQTGKVISWQGARRGLTTFPSDLPIQFHLNLSPIVLLAGLIAGFAWAFGMSMDFPGSASRFSRLTG